MRRRARLAEGDAGGRLRRRECHEVSCFVMRPAGNVMFCHSPPRLRSRCCPSVSRMPFLHHVSFRSVPAAALNAANIADGGVDAAAPNAANIADRGVCAAAAPNAANIADGGVCAAAAPNAANIADRGVDTAGAPNAWRDPVSRKPRRPAPARRRALAPARFARLIAPARAKTQAQGARLPSVSRGSFRAGANREGERPPGGRFLPPALYRRGISGVKQN